MLNKYLQDIVSSTLARPWKSNRKTTIRAKTLFLIRIDRMWKCLIKDCVHEVWRAVIQQEEDGRLDRAGRV